ncbi:MAG: CRISPR system precrRNA processing endoribonuclease RAMP protein Cas6 [Fervidicoccaceae archaeon]
MRLSAILLRSLCLSLDRIIEGVAGAFVRLLKIAEIVGVGKSRGIGLGEISLFLDS